MLIFAVYLLVRSVVPLELDQDDLICIESIQNRFLKKDLIYMVNFPTTKFNFPHVSYGNNSDFVEFVRVYPQAYIIHLEINETLEEILTDMDLMPNFNPRAKYLLVSEEIPNNIFTLLRKYYIFNAVFVHFGQQIVYELGTNEFKPIGNCLQFNQTIFQPKTVKIDSFNVTYLYRPPYTICASCSKKRKGIELSILQILSEYLNFTVHYRQSQDFFWGKKVQNGYVGAYKILDERQTEMLVGLFTVREDETWDFDPVTTYIQDTLNFVIPKAKPIPKWLKILYLFEAEVWLAYFSIAILLDFIFMLFKSLKIECFTGYQIFAFIYQAMTEVVPKFRAKTILFRLLCIFWLFQVLLLNTAMKSRLIYILTGTMYEHQVDSWADIVKSKYKIGLNEYIQALFNETDNPEEMYFSRTSFSCDYSWNCTRKVAETRNMVTAKFAGQMDYYGPKKFSDRDGKALLYLSRYVINSMFTSFIVIKGHPLVPKFRYYVARLCELGFVEHFQKESQWENYVSHKLANAAKTGFNVQPLGLREFTFPFVVLGIGAICSAIVFYMEFVVNNVRVAVGEVE